MNSEKAYKEAMQKNEDVIGFMSRSVFVRDKVRIRVSIHESRTARHMITGKL